MSFQNREQEKAFNEWWNGHWLQINKGRIQLSGDPDDLVTTTIQAAFEQGIYAMASRVREALSLDTAREAHPSSTGGKYG